MRKPLVLGWVCGACTLLAASPASALLSEAQRAACAAARTVRVEVSIGAPAGIDLAPAEVLTQHFALGGARVVESGPADAVVKVQMQAVALAAVYDTSQGKVSAYAGAQVTGSFSLSCRGAPAFTSSIRGRLDPPEFFRTISVCKQPSCAPVLSAVATSDIAETLARVSHELHGSLELSRMLKGYRGHWGSLAANAFITNTLSQSPPPEVLPVLAELITANPPLPAHSLADEVARRLGSAMFPAIRDRLNSSSAAVRLNAFFWLKQAAGEAEMRPLLKHAQDDVALLAWQELDLKQRRWPPEELLEFTSDPDLNVKVREKTARQLSSRGSRMLAARIVALLAKNPPGASSLRSAVTGFGSSVFGALLPLLKTRDAAEKQQVVSLLETISGQKLGDNTAKWNAWRQREAPKRPGLLEEYQQRDCPSCSSGQGAVTVKVISVKTRKPLSAGTFLVGRARAQLDKKGTATITGVDQGMHTLDVLAAAMNTWSRTEYLPAGKELVVTLAMAPEPTPAKPKRR